MEREQRQTVVTFALDFGFLERPQDVRRVPVGRVLQQKLPGRVGHAVHRLFHARSVEVLNEPLGPGVRLVLLERAERAVAVRERGLEALERPTPHAVHDALPL